MTKRPHILIFNPDQWRWDVLGHMGNPAAVTPNLDRAVETDFVSFRHAYCQNPVCTPSRCSFMTGWYPHVRGHRTMHHMLHPERGEPCLLKVLKDNGYFVWWGGKNDLVPGQDGYDAYCDVRYKPPRKQEPNHHSIAQRRPPDDPDFYSFHVGKLEPEVSDGEPYYDNDWANVLGAIDQIHNASEDKPLCIYLPLGYPHPPYSVEEPYYSAIDRAKIPDRIPAPEGWQGKPSLLKGIAKNQNLRHRTEEQWRELRAVYYGMCMRVDDQFGRVLRALKEAGIYDDTAVFFFSDHGDFTGDYGLVEKTQNTFEDVLTRVPFLAKPPGGHPVRPRVSNAMVELIDFTATVYDVAGIDPGYDHFGRSLLPVVSGRTDEHRDAVFCEGGRRHGEEQAKEKGSTSHLDRAGLYWPRVSLQQSEGPEHTKAAMCRTKDFKYVRRLYEPDELYDLRSDPDEVTNRIEDPALRDVLLDLKERMLTWYQTTCDVVPRDEDRRG